MEENKYKVYKAIPQNAYSGGMVLFSAENESNAVDVLKKLENELNEYYWDLKLGNISQIEGLTYDVNGVLIDYNIYME